MSKQRGTKSILIGFDITEIVIGLVILFGLGLYSLSEVLQHVEYLMADEKIETKAKYVSETHYATGLTEKDSDGNASPVYFYNITYEYVLDGKRHTFVAKDRSSSSKADRPLYLYRNGKEEFRIAEVAGMWAWVQWTLLVVSVLLGLRLIYGGFRGLVEDRKKK